MFKNILERLLGVLEWFFWTFVILVIIFFALGLIEAAWPGSLGTVLPDAVVFITAYVIQAVGLILVIFIIASLIRGGRLNILDLIEIWDNLKDKKNKTNFQNDLM